MRLARQPFLEFRLRNRSKLARTVRKVLVYSGFGECGAGVYLGSVRDPSSHGVARRAGKDAEVVAVGWTVDLFRMSKRFASELSGFGITEQLPDPRLQPPLVRKSPPP